MKWEKLGQVFKPEGQAPWMQSHASLPLALPLGGGRTRIYFATRDAANRSHVAWVEVADAAPTQVLAVAPAPALAPGPLGRFDDHGVYPASLVAVDDALWLYYIGWSPGARQPLFYSAIGLAESRDGGRTFQRRFQAPIVARGEHDPWMVTSPCVRREGERWRMWYVSGLGWEETPTGLESTYHLKYAESDDGVAWRREGHVALDLAPGEKNLARPCVLFDEGRYRMWFAYNRGEGYRLGYAESADGLAWDRRDDDVGITLGAEGWDDQAQAYPWVYRTPQGLAMLYNGNRYGRDGFGMAVLAP